MKLEWIIKKLGGNGDWYACRPEQREWTLEDSNL